MLKLLLLTLIALSITSSSQRNKPKIRRLLSADEKSKPSRRDYAPVVASKSSVRQRLCCCFGGGQPGLYADAILFIQICSGENEIVLNR